MKSTLWQTKNRGNLSEKKMRMFKALCEHPGGNVGDPGRPGARPALISGSAWSQSPS
jgi:hypothetical protein